MKIIGKTADGLLLSSTKDELANMVGFYWAGTEGCPPLEPGMEVQLSGMYTKLRDLKSNEKALAGIATKLRAVADVLELNDPIVTKLTSGTQGE